MNLQDFLKSVAKLPKAGSDFNSNWGEILDKDAAGWQAVVQDSANWDDLARQTKPRKAGAELMMAIVNLVGLDMANHFISSGNNDAKGNAKSWFLNNLSQYAKFSAKGKESIDADDLISNPGQVWKHLGKNKRTDLIDYAWAIAYKRWTTQMIGAFALHLHGASSANISLLMRQPACEDELEHIFFQLCRHSHHPREVSKWDDDALKHLLRRCNRNEPRTSSPLSPAAALSRPFWLPKLNPETRDPLKTLLACINSAPLDKAALDHYNTVRQKFLDMTSSIPSILRPDDLISATIPKEIKNWFKQKQKLLAPGETLPKFPKVEISDDDPPAFKENPGLKQRYEEDRDNINLECTDIEGLLGIYIWSEKRIVIWRKGVELCSRTIQSNPTQPKGLPFDDLFYCVLVHELGHWFNAEAKVANGTRWDLSPMTLTTTSTNEHPAHPNTETPNACLPVGITGDARSLSSRSYHEAWAQMFAWLYGQEVNANALAAFEALEKRQSAPYRAWHQLVDASPQPNHGPYTLANLRWSQGHILKSLEWSRSLKSANGKPASATFADPKFPNSNMLDWLSLPVGMCSPPAC